MGSIKDEKVSEVTQDELNLLFEELRKKYQFVWTEGEQQKGNVYQRVVISLKMK